MQGALAARCKPLVLLRLRLSHSHVLRSSPGSKPWPCSRPTQGVSRSIMAQSKAELLSTPGVHRAPDAETQKYIFQQTMYRIKDPKRSLDFYTRIIGMRLLTKLDFPDAKFSLYFLGFHDEEDIPEDPKERVEWMASQPAALELTHNWGTEDSDWEAHNGNTEPKGYGHIGLSVPDVYAACERFEKLGVEFVKKPDGGSMKGLAFISDPDGFWIEILNARHMAQSFA